MNKKEWITQIDEWRIKYGVPPPSSITYDPTSITVTCKKCNKIKSKLNRHHKCNDYLFACLLPDVYAKRYLEYRPADVDKLCEDCHRRWHNYIKPFLCKLYEQLYYLKKDKVEITETWCEGWRKLILERYERWLNFNKKDKKKGD